MPLKKYRNKRNFKLTAEPKGKKPIGKSTKNTTKLYVIQKHAASHLHYDFRLELNGVLLSWAVPKGPCLDPSVKRLAVHVEDHPLEYGGFEGMIPKGEYGGGTVMLWDRGEWISEDKNTVESYRKGHLRFILRGKKLKGAWSLVRIRKDDKTWLLIKGKDQYAKSLHDYDVTTAMPKSVLSRKTMLQIADQKGAPSVNLKLKPAPFLKKIRPELATLVDKAPVGNDWLHEIKYDGYRFIAYKEKKHVRLMTRNHQDWTRKFPAICADIADLPVDHIILDGEMVILDEHQHANFQMLQNAINAPGEQPFLFYVFDLLYYDKYNLTQLPLIKRKEILQQLLAANDGHLRYSDHIKGSGAKLIKKVQALGLEGIVSKRIDSLYKQERTTDWLKLKFSKRQEFVIAGYTAPRGRRSHFGSLLLGAYNNQGELIYVGHVGTGFTEESLRALYTQLNKYISKTSPFKRKPPDSKKVVWIKPVLIAEIEFHEWSKDGILRQASFKGLRKDKAGKSVAIEKEQVLEDVSSRSFKLTNPNKLLYPEDKISKQDVADYYAMVEDWILPYVQNRPLALLRCPDGYKECFFQKHKNKSIPDALHGVEIKEHGGKEMCIYLDDGPGLLTLAQLGVLEVHPWGSTIDNVENPDMITFDLDPDPDLPWRHVVSAALEIKKYLKEQKLKCFIKTTGGKGLHVVVPIKPEYSWDEIKTYTQTFVKYLVMQPARQIYRLYGEK